jgi:hypothetical protein
MAPKKPSASVTAASTHYPKPNLFNQSAETVAKRPASPKKKPARKSPKMATRKQAA